MAKSKNVNIELENIELKPQIIGHTYQKKSNLGRIIFLIVVLLVVVFYIDDISVFLNNIFGKETADTIKNNAETDTDNNFGVYKALENNPIFKIEGLTFRNFRFSKKVLTFDVINNTDNVVNISKRKIFLDAYNSEENRMLLETFKLNIRELAPKDQTRITLQATKNFKVISIVEKTIDDYPEVSITPNSAGAYIITCNKDNDQLSYTFENNNLMIINHTYSLNSSAENYQDELNKYQTLSSTYKSIEGFESTFSSNQFGFTMSVRINLEMANLQKANNIYYYSYKELAKVVKYEMEGYGFVCN